jgi:hypothetical protein
MCAEASTVLSAVVADFFFNCWYLEIPSDNHIRHISKFVNYHAQGHRLEMFYNFYVGSGSSAPELYSLSPDWFEYCYIYMRSLLLVESFDFRPSNQYILVRLHTHTE